MPKGKKTNQNEDLTKSIDSLIDEVFVESTPEVKDLEKSIDIAKDSERTADSAVNKAPKGQKDESRGAGRPKQISDVPQNDQDGRRASEYDRDVTENENKEDEPEETEQSPSQDQTQDKNRMSKKPSSPSTRPFKKSGEQISDEEWKQFQAFKKAQAEKAEQEALRKAEELKKAEKAEQAEELRKAVNEATEPLRKALEDNARKLEEAQTIIKALASQPQKPKSVTSIAALEKSQAPEEAQPEAFTKSQILDAAEDLVLKGQLPDVVVSEIEMTSQVSDPQARIMIEKHLRAR